MLPFLINRNEASVESELLLEGASGAASENVGTMNESVAAAAITGQHNKEDA